jgi:hypothetical protein
MSKYFLLLSLTLAVLIIPSSAQTTAPVAVPSSNQQANVVLADGTSLKLRMNSSTQPGSIRVGESLELEVAEDVRVGDVVVIAKGNAGRGEVTNLRSGGGSRGGWVDLSLESVTLADGTHIPIRALKVKPVRDQQALVVSSSGQDASITQGTDLVAYVDGTQQVDLTRLRAASGPTREVKVNSTPANAEISVDGRVYGSTPNTLRLPTGDHVMVLRMVGFQPWQRNLHVGNDPVTMDVSMVKEDGTESAPAAKPTAPALGDLARAARAHKAQATPIRVMDPDGMSATKESAPRDPMQPPANPQK